MTEQELREFEENIKQDLEEKNYQDLTYVNLESLSDKNAFLQELLDKYGQDFSIERVPCLIKFIDGRIVSIEDGLNGAVLTRDEALGFAIQREQLQGYPLNIWLNYYYLAYNIRTEKFDAVMKFIQSNEQGELSALLKDRYARYFSDQRDYEHLSQLIGPKPFDETKLSTLSFNQKSQMCRFYEANWPLDKVSEDAVSYATRIYLDLSKRPMSCNGLMSLFDAKGYLTLK